MNARHLFLRRELLEVFRQEAARAGNCETGGPLAGYITGKPEVVITHAGGPGPRAHLRHSSVLLNGDDTLDWLEQVYSKSSGLVWYVGDWHWHRGRNLLPSVKDNIAMQIVADYPGFNMPHPVSMLYRPVQRTHSERVAFYVWTGGHLEPTPWTWL